MSVVFHESRLSPTLGFDFVEKLYKGSGTSDEEQALLALDAQTPQFVFVNGRQLVKRRPQVENINDHWWTGKVRYDLAGIVRQPQTGDIITSFDTTGGTQKITQARQRLHGDVPSGSGLAVPTFNMAIQVRGGKAEGVDVPVPTFAFTETHYLPASTVTHAYIGLLFNMTARVNNNFFRGFRPGEVLFLGCTGTRRGADADVWEVAFRWACSPNRVVNDPDGDSPNEIPGFEPFEKLGWDYLWIYYEEEDDSTAFVVSPKPRAVYVDRVFEFGDFSALGIGS